MASSIVNDDPLPSSPGESETEDDQQVPSERADQRRRLHNARFQEMSVFKYAQASRQIEILG